MDKTPNLNLTRTNTEDGLTTFVFPWLYNQDGDTSTSNMGTVDEWAGETEYNLVNLYKNRLSHLYAYWATDDQYFSTGSSVGDVEEYYDDRLLIVTFDASSTGEACTLEVGSLGVIPIYKKDPSGNLIELEKNDIVSLSPAFLIYKDAGYFLLLNKLSPSTQHISGNDGDILIVSENHIASSGRNIDDYGGFYKLVSGSHVVLEAIPSLEHQWVISGGSGISLNHEASGSIVYIDIPTDDITNPLLGDNSVGSTHYQDGSIQAVHIADNSLTRPSFNPRIKSFIVMASGSISTVEGLTSGISTSGWRVPVGGRVFGRFSLPADADYNFYPYVTCLLSKVASSYAFRFYMTLSRADITVDRLYHYSNGSAVVDISPPSPIDYLASYAQFPLIASTIPTSTPRVYTITATRLTYFVNPVGYVAGFRVYYQSLQ